VSKFGIYIDGLEELKKNLFSGELNKKTILALGNAIEEIHNELQFSVFKFYATDKKLSSVRVNKRTTSSVQQRINSIIFGLEYVGYQIPLQDFKLKLTKVPPNGAMVPIPNIFNKLAIGTGDRLWIKRKSPLEQVEVQVRRDNGFTPTHRWFRGTIKGKKQILREVNFANGTWITPPNRQNLEGVRQPYSVLSGPSLPGMADQRFENDPKIAALIESLPDKLIKALL